MESAALNERVRSLLFLHRIEAGLTQAVVAKRLYMTERDYRRLEAGGQADIDVRIVEQFCTALRMPVHHFLLGGKRTSPDYAALITQHWALVCQLRESQEQMQQLLELLKE